MTQIVIAQYARTAFQPAHKGLLTKTRPDDMAAAVVSAVVERAGVDPATVEDVILGNATPEGEQGLLMGRLVALRAGFPKEVGGIVEEEQMHVISLTERSLALKDPHDTL